MGLTVRSCLPLLLSPLAGPMHGVNCQVLSPLAGPMDGINSQVLSPPAGPVDEINYQALCPLQGLWMGLSVSTCRAYGWG